MPVAAAAVAEHPLSKTSWPCSAWIVLNRFFTPAALVVLRPRRRQHRRLQRTMYHPATDGPRSSGSTSQMAVDMELSAWSIRRHPIQFPQAHPPRRAHLVIALDPSVCKPRPAYERRRPLHGRLANAGERLGLRNNSRRLMDAVAYGVEGDGRSAQTAAACRSPKPNRVLAALPRKTGCERADRRDTGHTELSRQHNRTAASLQRGRGSQRRQFWLGCSMRATAIWLWQAVFSLSCARRTQMRLPAGPPLPARGRALIKQAQLGVDQSPATGCFLFADRAALLDGGREDNSRQVARHWPLARSQPTDTEHQNAFAFHRDRHQRDHVTTAPCRRRRGV